MKPTRDCVAIYVRASTLEQNLAGQRKAMLEVARTRGWKVAHVYAEAKSTRVHRPELERMHAAALRHQHDAARVWRRARVHGVHGAAPEGRRRSLLVGRARRAARGIRRDDQGCVSIACRPA